MIENYSFGSIKISGKVYNSDLIILGDKIISSWWRKSGHKLVCEDMEDVFSFKPEIIVVGRGEPGLMSVEEDVIRKCSEEEIEFFERPTKAAVKLFNGYSGEGKKVAGCFHLTC